MKTKVKSRLSRIRDSCVHLVCTIKKELLRKSNSFLVKKWSHLGLNQGPHDYESCALTNWAIGPYVSHVEFSTEIYRIYFIILKNNLWRFKRLPSAGLWVRCSNQLSYRTWFSEVIPKSDAILLLFSETSKFLSKKTTRRFITQTTIETKKLCINVIKLNYKNICWYFFYYRRKDKPLNNKQATINI